MTSGQARPAGLFVVDDRQRIVEWSDAAAAMTGLPGDRVLGRPVPRDTLVELLWPGIDPDVGASRFYVVVHTLRQVVEPSASGHRWVFIRSDEDCYSFDTRAPGWLDIEEFRASVASGQGAEEAGAAGGPAAKGTPPEAHRVPLARRAPGRSAAAVPGLPGPTAARSRHRAAPGDRAPRRARAEWAGGVRRSVSEESLLA